MLHSDICWKFLKIYFQCYDEDTIEAMTMEMEMMTNPELVEKRKALKDRTGAATPGSFDPSRSHVVPVIQAEENGHRV